MHGKTFLGHFLNGLYFFVRVLVFFFRFQECGRWRTWRLIVEKHIEGSAAAGAREGSAAAGAREGSAVAGAREGSAVAGAASLANLSPNTSNATDKTPAL